MSVEQTTVSNPSVRPEFLGPRIPANWQIAVRILFGALLLITAWLFFAALAIGYGQLRQICTDGFCHPLQLSAQEAMLNRQLGLSLDFYAAYTTATYLVFGGITLTVAVLIYRYRADQWMSLLVAFVLVGLGIGSVPTLVALEAYVPQISWFVTVLRLALGFLPVILFVFPDGRFVPGWTKWLVLAWGLYFSYTLLFSEPMPSEGIASGPPSLFTQLVFLVGGISQIYRYLQATSAAQKEKTKWALFGFIGHIASLLILANFLLISGLMTDPTAYFVYERYGFSLVGLLPILFIPLSLAVCILRYRLWDIDVIINRTLVYSILTLITMLLYMLIVGGMSLLFHGRSMIWAFIATGIVAVSFQAIREWIQRMINRMMFGYRDEPYMVLDQLSQQLAPLMAADEVLPTVVRTVAQALRLPYVGIALRRGSAQELVASYPEVQWSAEEPLTILPLCYQSETIGELQLAQRGRNDPFSPADLKLLDTIAVQTSIAAYNLRLTRDLQRSREELVTTREEERRRLRRDLHDGLGPTLAVMSFRLDEIQNLVDRDRDKVKRIAAEIKCQVQLSLSEIRRIVYALRPPALDELGLVGALQEHIVGLDGRSHPRYAFVAPGDPLVLPAALEVAAYRIAVEAITNVERHANATECRVQLQILDDNLLIDVSDNGNGIPVGHRLGVGIAAMRERAAELGGQCTIQNRTPGTHVKALLPISVSVK
jgi:signal transduction histidine kinase